LMHLRLALLLGVVVHVCEVASGEVPPDRAIQA
jgi:hypothetical protein